jgi:hypothetical protein
MKLIRLAHLAPKFVKYEPLLFANHMPLLCMIGELKETLQLAVNVARLRENFIIGHFEISHLVAEFQFENGSQ